MDGDPQAGTTVPPEAGSGIIQNQERTWIAGLNTTALPENAVASGTLSTDPDATWYTDQEAWDGLPLWSSGEDLYLELPDGSYLPFIPDA